MQSWCNTKFSCLPHKEMKGSWKENYSWDLRSQRVKADIFLYLHVFMISINFLVLIEIHVLWLVEDYIISCYNNLAQGDSSRSARF